MFHVEHILPAGEGIAPKIGIAFSGPMEVFWRTLEFLPGQD
jgi:hypothetical protein